MFNILLISKNNSSAVRATFPKILWLAIFLFIMFPFFLLRRAYPGKKIKVNIPTSI